MQIEFMTYQQWQKTSLPYYRHGGIFDETASFMVAYRHGTVNHELIRNRLSELNISNIQYITSGGTGIFVFFNDADFSLAKLAF